MDDSSLDILPGLDDFNIKTSPAAEVHQQEAVSDSEVAMKPPLLATPIIPPPHDQSHIKVFKYTPTAPRRLRYEEIQQSAASIDICHTPPVDARSSESPTHVCDKTMPDASPESVKEILLKFIDSFLSVIGCPEGSKDTPRIATTALGNRVPFVPISAETVRKFGIEHPPVSQMLTALSPRTIPILPTEQPQTEENEKQLNPRRDSLVASPITEEMKQYLLEKVKQPIQFSQSVQLQNKKTEKIYLHFCEEMTLPPYPIQTQTLLAFLVWVAESRRFTPSSIDCVIYNSLCRLNVVRSGIYLDPMTQYAARAMIASFYRDPSLKPRRGGMLPIIPDDVSRMVEAMDFRDPKSYALAALFNFALSTGARGNSCANVRLCDLGPLYEKDDSTCLLVVRIVKLKGRPSETLQLSLCGSLTVRSTVDVIYWLNQHLIRSFKISLKNLIEKVGIESLNCESFIWPYSTDDMTQYLQSRLEAAGISPAHFGFHSFRSGFLASALIQGEKRGESIADVLVRCALVTGWKALGSVEFNYIREAARRRILPTNMIGTTCADPFMFPSSLEDPQAEGDRPWKHANTFEFHGLQTKVPVRKRKSYLFRLKDFLGELLWVPTATRISNHKYINSCYWWCLRKLGKELFESGEYSEEEFAHYQSKEQFYRHLGYTYLDHETRLNPDSFRSLAEEMVAELKTYGKIKTELPDSKEDYHPDRRTTVAPRIFTERRSGKCRKRLEWAEWEEKRLLAGIEKGEWADQIVMDLPARTQDDIYFHIRHLNKKRAAEKLPLLVFRRRRVRAQQITDHQAQQDHHSSSNSTAESSSQSHQPTNCDSSTEAEESLSSSDSSDLTSDSVARRRPPPLPKKKNQQQTSRFPGGKRRSS